MSQTHKLDPYMEQQYFHQNEHNQDTLVTPSHSLSFSSGLANKGVQTGSREENLEIESKYKTRELNNNRNLSPNQHNHYDSHSNQKRIPTSQFCNSKTFSTISAKNFTNQNQTYNLNSVPATFNLGSRSVTKVAHSIELHQRQEQQYLAHRHQLYPDSTWIAQPQPLHRPPTYPPPIDHLQDNQYQVQVNPQRHPYVYTAQIEPCNARGNTNGHSHRNTIHHHPKSYQQIESYFAPTNHTQPTTVSSTNNLPIAPQADVTLWQQESPESLKIMGSSQQMTEVLKPGPKLIWLLFMHRHGDRAPLNMAPRDKYNNISYWPEGFGNLNNAGRLRMFNVGKFIRKRYDGFLTDNMREVYSRSSDVDRCIESSHALLAGLYPPTNKYEWNNQLLWVPAAVHTVPAPEDYLLNEAGRKFLQEFVNEIRTVQLSEAVKKLYEESVKERELLEREMGYDYDMFYKFKCTYSTLDIEERNGLNMPAWYTPELKQKLYRFAGIAFGLAGGGTEKLKKIRCGHLLDDIISRMQIASIEGPKLRDQSDFQQPTNSPSEIDDRKVVHYSTHDSIMAAFLESLCINTPHPVPPGFGATFFIELYVDLDEHGQPISDKYVKLFYMDDTDSEKPIEKKLPDSRLYEDGKLTLSNFKKYIEHLLPSNEICNM